jgi:hypothetical protein
MSRFLLALTATATLSLIGCNSADGSDGGGSITGGQSTTGGITRSDAGSGACTAQCVGRPLPTLLIGLATLSDGGDPTSLVSSIQVASTIPDGGSFVGVTQQARTFLAPGMPLDYVSFLNSTQVGVKAALANGTFIFANTVNMGPNAGCGFDAGYLLLNVDPSDEQVVMNTEVNECQ